MKNLFSLSFLLALVFLLSASCQNKKENGVSAEDDVTRFAQWFVAKVSAGETDSIKPVYPGIEFGKDFVSVNADTVQIYEFLPDQFEVSLSNGVRMKVDRSNKGTMSIIETRGLFSFPKEKVELAKQTGMWDDGLNDVQLAERMRDEEFFKYIKNLLVTDSNKIITVGAFVSASGEIEGEGWYPIYNNSNVKIEGREYSIVMDEWNYDKETDTEIYTTVTRPGKDIQAHGSAQVKVGGGGADGNKIKSIQWNLSPEEIEAKFATFTGNEYQEFINSI